MAKRIPDRRTSLSDLGQGFVVSEGQGIKREGRNRFDKWSFDALTDGSFDVISHPLLLDYETDVTTVTTFFATTMKRASDLVPAKKIWIRCWIKDDGRLNKSSAFESPPLQPYPALEL